MALLSGCLLVRSHPAVARNSFENGVTQRRQLLVIAANILTLWRAAAHSEAKTTGKTLTAQLNCGFLKQADNISKEIIEYRYFTLDNSIPIGAKCGHAALRRTDQRLVL